MKLTEWPHHQAANINSITGDAMSATAITSSQTSIIMAKVMTEQNFKSIVDEGLPVVIDFSATWCGPCQKVSPIIDELATDYEGRVNICKCDVDENADLASQFGVRNIPTVIFLKGGELVGRQVGAGTKDSYIKTIEDTLL